MFSKVKLKRTLSRKSRGGRGVMMDEGGLLDSLEGVKEETIRQKRLYEKLVGEQEQLIKMSSDREERTKEFTDRFVNFTNALEHAKEKHLENMNSQTEKLGALQQEEARLREALKMAATDLEEQESRDSELESAANVITVVPQREVVFRGATRAAGDPRLFDVKTCIKYPMEGGTALITFEDEIVAQKVRSLQTHKVTLEGECYITVEAHPIQLMVPTSVQMDTRVCSRSILVSQLPDLDSEMLLDKLEIHFAKSTNGGGEVVSTHFQEDMRNAVLVFKDNIALGLTNTEIHEVQFRGTKNMRHKVRVTPFVNGILNHLETKALACPRTVLLTGIPDVMEAGCLQDTLEIFFQKGSNGGGEISNALYNPPGQTAVAIFQEDTGN